MSHASPASRSAPETLNRETILTRVREGLLAARTDLLAIVIFGSVARSGKGQDVDVLAVLTRPIASRAEWRRLVVELAEAIDLPAVDMVPVDLAGLRASLRAHRPLFMDIAFDGLVLCDEARVADLLSEARREILAAGIRRTETGWLYPVRFRQTSPLSPATNRERANQWLVDAGRDLEIAEQLKTTGYFDRSAYHSQQSIERSVKAVLICFGRFERVHWVGKKLREALVEQAIGEWKDRLEEMAGLSIRHEPDAIEARYIDDEGEEIRLPWERYGEAEAGVAIADAHTAQRTAHEFVDWWFNENPSEETHEAD